MKIKVPGCMTVTVPERRWFVLRLKPGMDDPALVDVMKAGYDVYLPRHRYDRHQRRQRVLAERSEPLMPGYMFVVHPRAGCPIDDWDEVRSCDGVLGPLAGSDGPLPIPPRLVEVMMSAEFEGVYDDTKAAKIVRGELEKTERLRLEKRFMAGKRFVVADGPFASFFAEVEELTHQDRVRTLVEIFGRMTAVEFEPDQLVEAPLDMYPRAA